MRHVRIRRLFSMMLSLVMVVGCIGMITPATELKAESITYHDIMLDNNPSANLKGVTGNQWYYSFDFVTDAILTFETGCANGDIVWNQNYWNVDLLINGEPKLAAVNYRTGVGFNFFRTYSGEEYQAGTTVEILAGEYTSIGAKKYGIRITKDWSYIWDGTKLIQTHEVSLDNNPSANLKGVTGNQKYYSFKFETEEIDAFEAGCESGDIIWNLNYWNVDILINGEPKLATVNYQKKDATHTPALDFFRTYSGDDYPAGTIVKIPAGQYLSTGTKKYGICITKDWTYIWNGTKLVPTYEVPLAGTLTQYGKNTYWGLKAVLSEKMESFEDAGLVWNTDFWKVPVSVNGTEKIFNVNYDGANKALDFFTTGLTGEPAIGTTFQIPAGKFTSESGKYGIEFKEASTFVWDGTKWDLKTSEDTYEKVPLAGTLTQYGKNTYWGLKAVLSEKIEAFESAGLVWNTDFWKVPVSVNGSEKIFNVNYDGANTAFDFFTIGLTGEPAIGTTFQIPAGKFMSESSKYGIEFEEAVTFAWDGTKWILGSQVIPYEKITWDGVMTQYGVPAYTYWGLKVVLPEKIGAFESAGLVWNTDFWKVPVLVNGSEKIFNVNYDGASTAFDFFTTGLTGKPENGTTFQIPAGKFLSESGKYGIEFEEEVTFTWDGTKWSSGKVVDTYEPITLAGTLNQYNSTNYWGLKAVLSEKIGAFEGAGLVWNTDMWKIPVLVNDSEKIFNVNYDGANTAFDFFTTGLTGKPENGTTFKIPAGRFLSESGRYGIEFSKEYIFYFDGSSWLYAKYDPNGQVTYEHVSLTENIFTPIFSAAGKYWSLTTELSRNIKRAADYEWDTDGVSVKVLVNGQSYDAIVNLLGLDGDTTTNRIAFNVAGINNGAKPERGTEFTILKGAYKARNFGYGISIDKDYTFYWGGEAWSKELKVIPYYEINFTGKSPWGGYKDTFWEVTFALNGKIKELADCEWNTDYWKVPVTVNGETKVMNVNYDRSNIRLDFFSTELKNTPANGCVFKIPAGKFLSESGKYGIEFKQDVTFVWDGKTWNGSSGIGATGSGSGSSAGGNKSPQTNDNSVLMLWVLLLLGSGMVPVVVKGRKMYRTRKNSHEN